MRSISELDRAALAEVAALGTRFRPSRVVGVGSMGRVCAAYDVETDTEVAIKVLHTASPEQVYELKNEFRSLANIVHPNLVELYELHVSGLKCFFTMELVEGCSVLDYLAARPDEHDTVAGVLRQLVSGIDTIHRAGKLHRDIKPSNIFVTPQGRVVILDFGLTTAPRDELGKPPEAAGTSAYMPPEYWLGEPPSAEGDWYGVGVVLYECLHGVVPFDAPPSVALERKQASEHAPLGDPIRAAHPEVAHLIEQWLLADPRARPSAAEALTRLGATAMAPVSRSQLVGRDGELQILREALSEVARGSARTIEVVGPSGIGKSELLRRFTDDALSDSAVVLRGRCYPDESVPYKAWDQIIDTLSRWLVTARSPSLRLDDAPALGRLFPVLQAIDAFRAHTGDAEVEPIEARRRGQTALRQLLGQIARDRTLIVWIDDLQWADEDSIGLLAEILHPPGAPFLLLLSFRAEDIGRSHALEALDGLRAGLNIDGSSRIDVGPLALVDAAVLLRRLCGPRADDLTALLPQATGSPFLLGELARANAKAGGEVPPLSSVLAGRLGALAEPARQVLATVAVAAEPVSFSVVLEASGTGDRGRPLLRNLEKRCLLRTTMKGAELAVEVYHDRVREGVLETLSADSLGTRHAALADSYERRSDTEPEILLRHTLGAGRLLRAAHWAEGAADRAADALAFTRAAELYRQVLELRPAHEHRTSLLTRHAEALANAGRGAASGDKFLEAARSASHDRHPRTEVLDLQRRAAENYLRTGDIDLGTRILRSVVAEVGVTYPQTMAQALGTALRLRTRLIRRGLEFEPTAPPQIPIDVKLRLNVCWGAYSVLALFDQALTETLAVRHLLDALEAGDEIHVAHAFGLEATKSRQLGGPRLQRRADDLIDRMTTITDRSGGAYERAHLHVARGTAAFQEGWWREGARQCDLGTQILRGGCRGVWWEIVTSEAFGLTCLAQMGDLRVVAERLEELLRDATARGDRYALFSFRNGFLNLALLAADDPERARAGAAEHAVRWSAGTGFDLQQYLHLIAQLHVDLYRGDGGPAWRRIEECWPKVRAALMLWMESPQVELRNMRGRAALAALSSAAASVPRRRLEKLIDGDIRRLARSQGIRSARPFAALLRAGLAHVRGETSTAVLYRQAAQELSDAEMLGYAAAAQLRAAEVTGDAAAAAAASADLAALGSANPSAMARLYCPAGGPPLH